MTEEEMMITSLLDCRRIDLIVNDPVLSGAQRMQLEHMKKRRSKGEPLQYILGSWDFMGLEFYVDQRVLVPRPETELMVEYAGDWAKEQLSGRPCRVLDLGTGSGNIAIALAKMVKDCSVVSIDVSSQALEVARENAKVHIVENKISFIEDDMTEFLKRSFVQEEKFDIIISNPPYIPTEEIDQLSTEVRHEPRVALDGGHDGLKYIKDIVSMGRLLLKEKSLLLFEMHDYHEGPVKRIFSGSLGYQTVEFLKDSRDVERICVATT